MAVKASGSAADMVILDLEDAVAPSEKESARGVVTSALRDLDWGDKVVGVRVNDWTSPWTLSDVRALVGGGDRLDVIVLPKVEDPAMVRALDLVLTQIELSAGETVGQIAIDAQIENAAGVQRLADICVASPRLVGIALGPLDLAASLGMPATSQRGRRRFDAICSTMVVAARAAGIEVLDGPYVEIRDLDGLGEDARWAADAGFDGKWVLHPDQIDIVNDAFSPSADALARARRILAAYDAATVAEGRGAILIDGEMVDEATCRIARRLVERGRGVYENEESDEETT